MINNRTIANTCILNFLLKLRRYVALAGAVLFLAACSADTAHRSQGGNGQGGIAQGGGGQGGGTQEIVRVENRTVIRPFTLAASDLQVRNLRAFPGEGRVTLSWTNPDSHNITAFILSSRHLDNASAVERLEIRRDLDTAANAADVRANITGLIPPNGNYTFGVQVVAGAGRYNTAPVVDGEDMMRTRVALGPNTDGDEYRDADDLCDNTHSSNFSLADEDDDGCYGVHGEGGEDLRPQEGTLGADPDNDGVADQRDNCPLVFNPEQNNTDSAADLLADAGDACDSDDDNDNIPDTDDNCQLHPNNDQLDTDMDGMGNACDLDDDGDTVPDSMDNCPLVANTNQKDSGDPDGLGDACNPMLVDTDMDGTNDFADNCPLVSNPDQANFDNATEPADARLGDACDPDDDNDGALDFCDATRTVPDDGGDLDNDGHVALNSTTGAINDIDCDGDQLIEIYNATQLYNVRYNLAGTSYDDEEADDGSGDTGNANGCGGNLGGTATTTCNGYELAADIDLHDPAYNNAYLNWQPIGTCVRRFSGHTFCWPANSDSFTGSFDGGGLTISNLNISVASGIGLGLFASVGSGGVLHNISLAGVAIDAPNSGTVGALVGHGLAGSTISHNRVTAGTIRGDDRVGGLAGWAEGEASFNSVEVDIVHSDNRAGGLAGEIQDGTITYNRVVAGTVRGRTTTDVVGALAGFAGSGTAGAGGRVNNNNATVTDLIGMDGRSSVLLGERPNYTSAPSGNLCKVGNPLPAEFTPCN